MPRTYTGPVIKEVIQMDKLKNKILQTDFPKFWKRFLPSALVLLLIGGIAAGISLRPQISEAYAYAQQLESSGSHSGTDRQEGAAGEGGPQDREHDHWKEDFFENAPISEPSLGVKLLLVVYALVCCLILAVYYLAFAAWLYQAGTAAHMCGPLWLLAGLLGNLAAGVLFLFLRSIFRRKCTACGQWLQPKARFCVHCGKALYARCPACGKECSTAELYCAACGHSLREAEQR